MGVEMFVLMCLALIAGYVVYSDIKYSIYTERLRKKKHGKKDEKDKKVLDELENL